MIWTIAVVLCVGQSPLPRHVFSPDTGSSYDFNVRGCANVNESDVVWLMDHGYLQGKEGDGEPDISPPIEDYYRR